MDQNSTLILEILKIFKEVLIIVILYRKQIKQPK